MRDIRVISAVFKHPKSQNNGSLVWQQFIQCCIWFISTVPRDQIHTPVCLGGVKNHGPHAITSRSSCHSPNIVLKMTNCFIHPIAWHIMHILQFYSSNTTQSTKYVPSTKYLSLHQTTRSYVNCMQMPSLSCFSAC